VIPFVFFLAKLSTVGDLLTGAGVGKFTDFVAAFAFALVIGLKIPVFGVMLVLEDQVVTVLQI